jgi:hypothetical protein
MNQNLLTIQNIIQQSKSLNEENKNSILKALKDADKELEITAFKLDRTEKVKKTTAILLEETIEELEQKRKAVEIQNRELEIETALEKVRSSALSMKQPGDMLGVCQIISEQLEGLKVKEIRNVQTAIFYESKGTYLNYEYYVKHNKSMITEVDYKTHDLQNLFANQMLSGAEELFRHTFESKELKDWYEYQKTTNQFADFYLEKAEALNYYWYSLGPVALGMSTYSPLNEDEINLFKRFRNVFELAYRRFMDIQQAAAQAREAQIEVALERVRSRTMAMHQSDELAETATVVFKQLMNLGIEPNRIYIAIIKDENGIGEFWITDEDGSKVSSGFTTNLNDNLTFLKMFEGWKEHKKSITIDMHGKELEEYFKQLNQLNVPFKGGLSQKRRVQNIAYFSKGFIGIASPEPQPEETINLLERFAGVFNLTFTRFLDLKNAEAQNKIIQAENDRKTKELEDARNLQLAMLPRELPQLPNLDIAVYMKTATEVGGDYYDFHVHLDGTLTVILGDATGHGMMSGMMVSVMKSFFMAGRADMELKQFFENSNKSIKDMRVGRLMMALMGVQITSDKVIAANAGMPSLFYFRNKSQKAGEFVINNMPLGAMNGIKYPLKEIKHEKGDTLLLMSDGFAELKNENNEIYGYQRALKNFVKVVKLNPEEIIEHLKEEGRNWSKDKELEDDISFVVIKLK